MNRIASKTFNRFTAATLICVTGLALATIAYASSQTMTKQSLNSLSPDDVLKMLKEGNQRFVSGNMLQRDLKAQVKATAHGQYPMATILSCIDSRVPVEMVFDMGIGDVFVGRVAGNYIETDILGSFEYATKVAGSKLIVVLGHTSCGAVKGACDGVKMGNLTETLSNLEPAMTAVKNVRGERNSKNKPYVNAVVEMNVKLTIQAILDRSDIIRDLVEAGNLKIVGGVYDLKTGKVNFLDSGSMHQ